MIPYAHVGRLMPCATACTGSGKPGQVDAATCAAIQTSGRLDEVTMGQQPMRYRVFHQARIADMMFEGVITGSGPTLSCQMNASVALGVSGLRQFQPGALGSRRPPPPGWWVVKYHVEERIFLPDFDRDAIHELSDQFGLVVLADDTVDPSDRIRQHCFFTSPAWDGLRQWVIRHPRLAKTYAPYDPYLPRWYQRAIIEAEALSVSPPPLRPPGRGTAWL